MQILKHLNRPKNQEKLDSRRKCEAPVRWRSDLLVEWTHVKLWFDRADAQLLPFETLCLSQGLLSVASNLDVWMRESSVISFSRLLPVALSWDVTLRERRYQTVNVREKRVGGACCWSKMYGSMSLLCFSAPPVSPNSSPENSSLKSKYSYNSHLWSTQIAETEPPASQQPT